MSRSTFSPTHNTYTWSGSQQQLAQPVQRLQHKPGTKTDCQISVQPVQRVDSFGTSDSSYEPLSTFSTESYSNFDHLTPTDSTHDDGFRTPEIDDLLWQEHYNAHDELPTSTDLDVAPDMGHTVPSQPPRSAGLASHMNSLPSPESTNISTPEALGHSKMPSQSSTLFTSPTVSPNCLKRPVDMDPTMSSAYDTHLHLETPVHNHTSHLTSPVIQINSVTRADSPARSDGESRRPSKKRSASNLAQGEYFPDVGGQAQASMLMPPGQEDDVDWEEQQDLRSGVAPVQRDGREHPSFSDLREQQEQDKSVNEVRQWLETASLDAFTERNVRGHVRPEIRKDRIRSRSTGARPHAGQRPILKTNAIPGPGLMIEEESDYYYSSDDEESNYSINPDVHNTEGIQPLQRMDSEVAPDQMTALPSDLFRVSPWQDTYRFQPLNSHIAAQPESSQAAIYRFNQRAKEFDTLSRSATWGTQQTRRRLSDGDMSSLLGDNKTRHLSLTKSKIRERGSSILQRAKSKAGELKRSNSRSRQSPMPHEVEEVQSPEPIEDRSSIESQTLPLLSSSSKSKSPSIATAIRGTTGSLTAVGAGMTGLAVDTDQQSEGFFKRTIRRVRSKSDVNKSPKSPSGLMAQIFQEGGMPLPTLTAPQQEESLMADHKLVPPLAAQEQMGSPIRMPLSPRPANVVPSAEGFKVQVLELNPSLAQYLVERVAHDQYRRYKRLVSIKAEHKRVSSAGKCQAGSFCTISGGEAEILPPRPNGRDTTANSSHFRIAPGADSDNDDSLFDGIVTPAAFPDGIPLPPAKKLPARFECPLCFQVRAFNKPSDWTKHVHEDVQPFTCTFPNCPEPKSFKRKADWVRHENERHRHLEWWQCNLSECTHVCYRKDNFVQHLVREHKREEPKVKNRVGQGSKTKGKSRAFTPEELEFWNLVDGCRHESTNDAKNEPCKFCGNICTSWKRLSVHVGKHMEQIAMPVLDLVEKRIVTEETVISPVEPLPSRALPFYGVDHPVIGHEHTLSPFSATNTYQSSSAEQSPHPPFGTVSRPHVLGSNYGATPIQQRMVGSTPFPYGTAGDNTSFPTYIDPNSTHYGSYNGQHDNHGIYPLINHMGTDQGYSTTSPAMNGSDFEIHSTYNNQAEYFSSPEQPYAQYHTNGGFTPNHPSMQMQARLRTPVTTQGTTDENFLYAQHQAWHQ